METRHRLCPREVGLQRLVVSRHIAEAELARAGLIAIMRYLSLAKRAGTVKVDSQRGLLRRQDRLHYLRNEFSECHSAVYNARGRPASDRPPIPPKQ